MAFLFFSEQIESHYFQPRLDFTRGFLGFFLFKICASLLIPNSKPVSAVVDVCPTNAVAAVALPLIQLSPLVFSSAISIVTAGPGLPGGITAP